MRGRDVKTKFDQTYLASDGHTGESRRGTCLPGRGTDRRKRGGRIETTLELRAVIEKALSFLPEKERKEEVKKACARNSRARFTKLRWAIKA